jgi:hypothetical protein
MTQNEYATFIYYFGAREKSKAEVAELISDALKSLRDAEWAWPEGARLPIAGAVLAFETLYPDRAPAWRREFPSLYARVMPAMENNPDDPQWIEFHIAQWYLLRRESSLDSILDLIADFTHSFSMRSKIEKAIGASVPLRKAFLAAKRAREASMLIQ